MIYDWLLLLTTRSSLRARASSSPALLAPRAGASLLLVVLRLSSAPALSTVQAMCPVPSIVDRPAPPTHGEAASRQECLLPLIFGVRTKENVVCCVVGGRKQTTRESS